MRGLLPLLALVAACSAPPPRELVDEELIVAALERSDEDLAQELEHWQSLPAPIRIPEKEERAAPGTDGYWHARVLGFGPELRQQRRRVLQRLARREDAGLPGPLVLAAGTQDLEAMDEQFEASLSIEIFSLLGIGRRSAEFELRSAELAQEIGRLLEAGYAGLFAVDRLRVELGRVRAVRDGLEELLREAQPGLRRIEASTEFGVLGPALRNRARGVVASVTEAVRELDAAIFEARQRLAVASGLRGTDPALAAVDLSQWDVLSCGIASDEPEPAALLLGLPALRRRKLEYARAEAELRHRVAQQWPSLRLGPRLTLRSDEYLTGGLLAIELPWPGSERGAIEAAVQEREQVRVELEDALLAAANQSARTREQFRVLQERLTGPASERLRASEAAWRANRARVWSQGRSAQIDAWVESFQLRAGAIESEIRARARLLLAELEVREASGGLPGLDGLAVGEER